MSPIEMENLKEVESWSGGAAMLPVGWHTVRIAYAKEGQSSGGHPQVEMEFVGAAGASIRDWIVFAPAKRAGEVPFAWKRAKGLLEAAAIDIPDGKMVFPTEQLQGRKLDIYVGEEPDYNDPTKTRRRVQGYAIAGEHGDSDIPAEV